jgi:cytochrome P450
MSSVAGDALARPALPVVADVPGALPVIGHLAAYLPDKLRFLEQAASLGRVVRMQLGSPTYLLTEPEDIRHVLETHASAYEKTPRLTGREGRRLSGNGLLTSASAEHRGMRRPLQPLFHRQVIDSFGEAIVRVTDEVVDGWAPRRTVDLAEEMLGLGHRVIGRALFGLDFAAPEGRRLGTAFEVRRRYLHDRVTRPIPLGDRIPRRIVRQYHGARRVLDREVHHLIRARQAMEAPPPDFLTLLLDARDGDGQPLPTWRVYDEVLTLAATGYETIAAGLAWTWLLLARHPHVRDRVVEESARVLAGRPPSPSDAPSLPYTGMVLAEALRLYPPTWIFIRMASYSDALPSGARIPAGAKVYLCPWVVHRGAHAYADPLRFDPARFEVAERLRRPKGAYFPFGLGPRMCLGQPLALLEGTLVLVRVLQRCRLEVDPALEVVPHAGVTLSPRGGLPARVSFSGGP